MERRYDTYGLANTSLDQAAMLIAQLLGYTLEARDSGYYGGTYYQYALAYNRKLRLYHSHDPNTGAAIREYRADCSVILEVSDLDDMNGIQQKLFSGIPGVVLLESETLPARSEVGDDDETSDSA